MKEMNDDRLGGLSRRIEDQQNYYMGDENKKTVIYSLT